MPFFSIQGFGIHTLALSRCSISINQLYSILVNTQKTIKEISLEKIKIREMSPLEVFTGNSRFDQLRELKICAKDHQFWSKIVSAAPALKILTIDGNFTVIKGKLGLKKLTIMDSKSDFPEILEPRIQITELAVADLHLNEISNTNFTNFLKTQENIEAVKFTINAVPISVFAAVFNHIFNLKSLKTVSLSILEDNIDVINENFPAANIKNPNVQWFEFVDGSANLFSHSLRLFPSVTNLKVGFDCLLDADLVPTINGMVKLRCLTICGDNTREHFNPMEFLDQLRIANLEEIYFEHYHEIQHHINGIEEFVKNHPKIKMFKIEANGFGLAAIEVVVTSLKNLENLVVSTETTDFDWQIDDINRFRSLRSKRK